MITRAHCDGIPGRVDVRGNGASIINAKLDAMPQEDPAAQRAKSQTVLVEFLTTDLDLALRSCTQPTFTHDQEHRRSAVQTVRRALENIRHLEGRIENRDRWKVIHARADELESALRAF